MSPDNEELGRKMDRLTVAFNSMDRSIRGSGEPGAGPGLIARISRLEFGQIVIWVTGAVTLGIPGVLLLVLVLQHLSADAGLSP